MDGYLKFLAKVPTLSREKTQHELDQSQEMLPVSMQNKEDNRLSYPNPNYREKF